MKQPSPIVFAMPACAQAQDSVLHAIDVRVVGPDPDLQTAFAKTQAYGTQALVAPENAIIGVYAAQIAERSPLRAVLQPSFRSRHCVAQTWSLTWVLQAVWA